MKTGATPATGGEARGDKRHRVCRGAHGAPIPRELNVRGRRGIRAWGGGGGGVAGGAGQLPGPAPDTHLTGVPSQEVRMRPQAAGAGGAWNVAVAAKRGRTIGWEGYNVENSIRTTPSPPPTLHEERLLRALSNISDGPNRLSLGEKNHILRQKNWWRQ